MILGSADHFRKRAEEALVLADRMVTPDTRRIMIQIAADYHLMAQQSEVVEGVLCRLRPATDRRL